MTLYRIGDIANDTFWGVRNDIDRAIKWGVLIVVEGLQTRSEFIDSLNMEAAAKQMGDIKWDKLPAECPPPGWIEAESRAIVEAALGKDAE